MNENDNVHTNEKPRMKVQLIKSLPSGVTELTDDKLVELMTSLGEKYHYEFVEALDIGKVCTDGSYGYRVIGGIIQKFNLE